MIRLVTEQDMNAWLELAGEVEPLFGEMVGSEDFIKAIKDAVSNASAFCYINSDNEVEGIISIDKALNEVSWLAVGERSRGKGYGHELLKAALDDLDNKRPVYVQTFSPDVKSGGAARRIYRQFGFQDYKDGGKNPAEIDTIIMKLEGRSNQSV